MTKISWETEAIQALLTHLVPVAHVTVERGMGPTNRLTVPGWTLVGNQRPQFGDLRLEASHVIAVVEVESSGGVGNLVKYWPWLRARSESRRFVLAHVFRASSENDYVSHRLLWEFLRERMRDDLTAKGVYYGEAWEAQAFSYAAGVAPALDQVAAYLRTALSSTRGALGQEETSHD